MSAYYNENDPYAAQWLRNLIAAGFLQDGDVDERSIADVPWRDLRGYSQCHFFAGIGGWPLALQLAGWPDGRPVWTGSCPCQPFSPAARGRQDRRQDTERNLWPYWRQIIFELAPSTIFGEQIAQAGDWFDEVCTDMETMGYAIGASVLTSCGVGKDHTRPRLYFVGHSDRDRQSRRAIHDEASRLPGDRSVTGEMVLKNGLSARVAQLSALGNAIDPQLAAQFIRSATDAVRGD
jgi:DNA (cytosine-5)-methyltransferase 1